MKHNNRTGQMGFTLVELLAVIAIIGMLAGLVLYLGPTVNDNRKRKLVHAQIEQLTMLLEHYKEVKGTYPPENRANPYVNTLYYELTGTNLPPGIDANAAYGVGGIINVVGMSSDTKNFFRNIKDTQWREINVPGGKARVLGVNVSGPKGSPFTDFCPWYYRVSPQTNDPSIHNAQGFDLWVEVELNKGRTVLGNWKDHE